MKILYINKVSPHLGGGAELRLLEIGRRLVDRGHQVHVICSKTEPGLPDYETIQGIKIHYLSLLPDSFFRLKRLAFYLSRYFFYPATLGLGKRIAQIAPDVIIDYIAPSPSLVYPLARQFRIPCCAEVMEYRGNQWFKLSDPLTALLGLFSQIFLLRFRYDKFIVISNFTRCELMQAGVVPENIAVVPCGVSVENFKNSHPLERDSNSLIVIGRLVPQKGHVYLFDALTYVRELVPEVKLHVVGDGPIRSQLEQYVRQKKLHNNVVFTGRITDDEKRALLWSSSLFVSPSLQEGFGIVLLEAMACGLPIVAFDLPVYQEFVDSNCGFLVPKGDIQAMAKQIVYFLQDVEKREKVSAYNLVHVRQFKWDEVTSMAEQILYDIL